MQKSTSESGLINSRVLSAFLLCSAGVLLAMFSFAATPPSGVLTDVSGPLNYTAGPFNVPNQTPLPEGLDNGPECNNPSQPCDDFALTITLPAGYTAAHPNVSAKVTLSWTDAGSGQSDYDLYVYKNPRSDCTGTSNHDCTVTDGSQAADHQSASSANPEITTIKPLADGSQKFTVVVVPFTPSGETVNVKIELVTGSNVPSPPAGLPGSGPGVPRFFNYVSPNGIADSVGEPSIGSNWLSEKKFSNSLNASIPNGGTALLFGGFSPNLARATFNDCSSPAGALWEAKPLLTASTPRAFGDPILFTDPATGRTFVSQLEGLTPAGSTTDITDDDGDSFTPSEGSSLPSDVDHQTIGGGPYNANSTPPPPPNLVYPDTVYYCSQSVADARCGRSDDGGLTFGPATVMYTTADCGGLHGHIKVAPDGTAYVPNNACGGTADPVGHSDGNQAVIVSTDNGITWSIRPIPGSTTKSDHDGSVAVASDSKTIYEGFQSGDGHPRIAVSHDKGLTWSAPFDVGTTVIGGGPILNTGFAAVVAGDPNRAAFAFYGTVTGGNDWDTAGFSGEWFLYVATTYDGGVTWSTQNLTPGDPIQRGGICGAGACRNHLDFFGAVIDKEGRVVIGYTDGCVTATCINGGPNDYTAKGTIARQTGGKRMFAANDPTEPAVPGAPLVSGSANSTNTEVKLSWPVPDDGGSPLTAFKISRGPSAAGPFTLIATIPGSKNNYTDTGYDPTLQNFYIVTAENAIGTGPSCGTFHPPVVTVVVENACKLPGLTILTDPSNDELDMVPAHDVQSLQIAEPIAFAPNKVVFTLKMQSLATVPPGTRWPVTFDVGSPAVNYTVRMTNVPADGATTAPIFQVGPTGGTFVAADPASTFLPDGTITIVVPRSAIGNPAPGQSLTGFLTRIAAGVVTPDNMPDSLAPSGSYTIAGNIPCIAPNAAPTALLTGTPQSGPAPLTVNFTGAGSTDPDPGDSIASYTFNFGDGSPAVTQSSPTISHTYNVAPGQYTADLTVTDSHGLASTNPALFVINVSAVLRNISTRAQVLTGDNVLIGGFIITGTQPKKVIVRAIGPSLKSNGQPIPGTMQDPTLELHGQNAVIATNDNWKINDQNQQSQQAEIEATGIPPTDDRESALVRTLTPGSYTVVLRGKNNSTGIAVVEAYDLDSAATSQLANISSRGLVQTGDNVMIGGFVAGPETAANTRVVVRGIGPSLSGSNVPTPLQDPTLELHNGNGDKIATNDNWKIDDETQQSQQAAIQATGLAPKDDRESAILIELAPDSYTAILAGKGGTSGNGLVEIYSVP
jgi:PKD repeat protein